jgi:hypothetical protein
MATPRSDPPDGADRSVHIRAATPADHEAIVELAGSALGWTAGEPNAEQFRWKHLDNPFGPSAMWVAEERGELVAFRAMMRWRFRWGGHVVDAVRAVDTATRPSHQGRGLFRALTMHAVDSLIDGGVAFVYNTPNANSRPGYLRMGWEVLGRVPVSVQVASPGALPRVARARVAADKWSAETTAGEPAVAVLTDVDGLAALLAAIPTTDDVVTDRSVDFLRWRYGAGPVRYRVEPMGNSIEEGAAFFRLRRRGQATEATVADVLVPGNDPRARRALVGRILQRSGADYAIATQRSVASGRALRLPRQGPILTWRPLADRRRPVLERWSLALGDVELF